MICKPLFYRLVAEFTLLYLKDQETVISFANKGLWTLTSFLFLFVFFFAGTRALSYAEGSYTKYLFYERKINNEQRETKIQMQIRTRDPDGGVLMYNYGSEEGRFSLLEVRSKARVLSLRSENASP